jgi:purine-binding chemotaxis protein CheW
MAGSPAAPGVRAAIADLGGKYLTFGLAHEEYGLEILQVREIMGMMDITPVPRTPAYVRGVINLRGNIIPVVDLRLKFAMEAAEATDETCIIVVDANAIQIGVVVDRVSEVLDISQSEIQEAPSFGDSASTEFILGIGKANNHVTILLDIARVLAPEEEADPADTLAQVVDDSSRHKETKDGKDA